MIICREGITAAASYTRRRNCRTPGRHREGRASVAAVSAVSNSDYVTSPSTGSLLLIASIFARNARFAMSPCAAAGQIRQIGHRLRMRSYPLGRAEAGSHARGGVIETE